jgi:hypothetical protein
MDYGRRQEAVEDVPRSRFPVSNLSATPKALRLAAQKG